MLSRTIGHSQRARSIRAISLALRGDKAHIHSNHVVAGGKSTTQSTPLISLAKEWRQKTVIELKAELKRRGLLTTGKKEEA